MKNWRDQLEQDIKSQKHYQVNHIYSKNETVRFSVSSCIHGGIYEEVRGSVYIGDEYDLFQVIMLETKTRTRKKAEEGQSYETPFEVFERCIEKVNEEIVGPEEVEDEK
jgi:hypothetical protein